MPVTLDHMIHQDSVDFIQIVDSSKIQTLLQIFPEFIMNSQPIQNDSLSFVGYRNRDSTIELGATICKNGAGAVGLRNILDKRQFGWTIFYQKDSIHESYMPTTGYVINVIEVKYDDSLPPLEFEEETFHFNFENTENPEVVSSVTYSGTGDRAIFYVSSEFKEYLSELGNAAFERTKKIIADHKGGEWLK